MEKDNKIKLKIRVWEIPVRYSEDGEVHEVTSNYKEECKEREDLTEEIELDTIIQLNELAQKVAKYNKRSLIFAKNTKPEIILKKIIVKQ